MQPNTLTINVDTLNTGSTTPEVYNRSNEFENRSVYIGASHALDSRDTIGLYRSYPSKNGNFKGVAKTSLKFTKDIEVTGVDGVSTLTSPIIFELSASIPVGATDAQILECRQRVIALVDDDTVMVPLNTQLLV